MNTNLTSIASGCGKEMKLSTCEKTVTNNQLRFKFSDTNLLNKWKKQTIVLVTIICAFAANSFGQAVSSYSFTQSSTTYKQAGAGAKLTSSGCYDDANFAAITIPFTFTYHGVAFTTITAQQNGFAVLGGSGSGYSAMTSTANVLSPFNTDLYGCVSSGADFSYATVGSTPNRVLTLQWTNWGFWSNGLNEQSFQIKLYETSNNVQFVYGPAPGTSVKTVYVGLTGATTADFQGRTTTTDWASTTAAGSPSLSTCSFSSTVKPGNGLTFTWAGNSTVAAMAFSQSITNYVPIEGAGAYTCLTTSAGSGYDDSNFGLQTIPFNFNYHGATYNTISMQQNGYAQFASTGASGYSPICSFGDVLCPLGADLYSSSTQAALGRDAAVAVIGSSPNRVYVLQWSQWGFWSGGLNEVSFQIRLTETTNVIQFVYGPAPGTNSRTAYCGLTGTTTADFQGRTTSTDWNATTASPSACTSITVSSSVRPVNGLTFTFAPPACSNPTVNVSPTATICGGQSTVLTASGTATSYSWAPATGLSATTGATVTATPAASTVYTVTGTVVGGCATTATVAVLISPAPSIVVSATPSTPCNGANSQLNTAMVYHISAANIINGTSNCGNGPYTCSGNVGFSWADIGSGTVTGITIQWAQGVECSAAGFVHPTTLNGVATPSFVNTLYNCACSPATPPIYSMTPATTGYVVGGTNTFLVTSLPTCYGFQNNTGGPSVLGADYATVTVTYTGGTGGTTFSWSPATFLNSTTAQNPLVTGITASTVYTVTATNPAGCSSTSTVALTIDPLVCGAMIAPTACTGSNFTVASNTSGGGLPYSYAWSNGSTSASLTDNQATAGSYTYTVIVTDACNNTCSSSVTVVVNQTPTASITPAGPISTCANQPVTLTANTSGGSPTYVWMNGANVIAGQTGPTLVVNATGSYSVVITDGSCSAVSNTVSVAVNPIPTISASSNFSIICQGDSAQITTVTPPPTIAGYIFSQSTTTYTPISGGTILSPIGTYDDDNSYANVPIGFTFNYHGSPFTTLGVDANGYMQFGGVAPSSYYSGTSIQSLANAMHPFSEDLLGNSATCEIEYITTGSVGNRVFTIQWKDWGFYSTGGSEINFQAKLYEATKEIQFIYQPITPATVQTPQVGLTGTTVADFNSRTTTTNWSATTASVANTNQMTWNNSGVVPANGLTFTFTPPPTVTLSWSPAAGLSSTTIGNPKASPAIGTTIYTVTATAIGTGCTNTATVSITNLGYGDAPPTVTNATACYGQMDHLAAAGTSTLRWYDLQIGGNLMHIGTNWDSVWTASATYWVESFNGQCPSQRTMVTVTVLPLPLVNAGVDVSICPLDSVSIGSLALGSNIYYMHYSGGDPWGSASNTNELNAAFGSGNWTLSTYESNTPAAATIFGSGTKVVFMEGSDASATAFNSYFTANQTAIENWVSSGGHLFINAAPNVGGNINFGFGGVLCNYPIYTATATITSGQSGHPIFNGPALPVGNTWTGGSFGHATITGGSTTALIDGAGNPVLTEKSWGAGKVVFGGMTMTSFHSPQPNADNLRTNILAYLNTGFSTGTYSWSPAAGLSSTSVSNPMASPIGTTNYTVTITSALNGCTATDVVQVTVNPAPPTPTINGSTPFCGCGQTTLTATANGVGTTIRWYDAATGGTLLGTGSPFLSPYFCGAKTFYAEEFDATSGCRSIARASILVTPISATAISAGSDVLLCSGAGPAVLTATSSNPNYTYSWSPAAGLSATVGATVSASPSSTTDYIVTGTDNGTGCVSQDTVKVKIGIIPTVNSITSSNNNFCVGNSTQLNVSASLPGSVNDPGGECVPTFSFAGATDDYLNNFTFNTISNLNSGDAAADYTNYPAVGSYTTTVSAGSTYNISVQSGSASWNEGFTVWIDYSRNGIFEPGEMVYQSAGTSPQVVYSGTVTIPPGTITGTARMRVFCMYSGNQPSTDPCNSTANASFGEVEDYTISILGSGPAGSLSYAWTPASGLSSSTIANPVSTPSGTTTYTVTVNDQAGCSATTSITINTLATPSAPVTTNATVCGLNVGTVTATPSGGTIKWLPSANSGQIIATGNSYSATVGATTTFYAYEDPGSVQQYVGLSATAPGGISYASASTNYQTFDVLTGSGIDINTVDIVPAPTTPIGTPVQIQLENNVGTVLAVANAVTTTQGAVQTITLNFHVPAGTAYRLRPSQNPNLQYHQSGFTNPYTIPNQLSITGWDSGTNLYVFFYNWSVNTGCYSVSSPATITVNTPPVATITPSGTTTFCGSGTVNLTGGGGSYVNFNWTPAAGLSASTGATVTANPSQTTIYTLTANDGLGVAGCVDTATITVFVYPAPSVAVAAAPQDTICLGTGFNLTAIAGSASVKQIGAGHNPANNLAIIYNGGNASVRSQIIYTQAELNAAGLVGPTNILSIAFEVSNKLSTGTYTGFTINMAGVGTAPPLSGTYLNPAFTTVFSGNVTTSLGWNTHIFSTPFAWDGTSNVIVDICNGSGPPFGFDQVYCTPTVSASAIDITTLGCSAASGAATLNRPNTRFTGGLVNYSWSPGTDIIGSTTVANPLYSSTTVGPKNYTVTVTDPATGCTVSSSLNFVVSTTPKNPQVAFYGDSVFCVSGIPNMRAYGSTGTFQWQSSSDGVNFTSVNCTNNNIVAPCDTFTGGSISATTYYRVFVSCGGDSSYSRILTAVVNNPQVLTTTPGSRCGVGSVNLSATVNGGSGINWFSTPTGGTSLGNALSFTTPVIGTTTTFYAEANAGGGNTLLTGLGSTIQPTDNSGWTAQRGIVFNATSNFTLVSAQYYSSNTNITNTVTVVLQDNVGTQLQTTTLSIPQGGAASYYTMNLNWTIPVGTGYRLLASFSSTVYRDLGANYANAPYNNLGPVGVITSGYDGGASSSTYNYFNNISVITAGCSSTRVPVVATVTPPPALVMSGAGASCAGDNRSIGVTSVNDPNYAYTWQPGSLTGASQVVSPVASTTYTVTAVDNTSGCANVDSVVLVVNQRPGITSLTSTPQILCASDSAQISLTAVAAIPPASSVAAYAFSQSTTTYTPISGGTVLSAAGIANDDNSYSNVPIGFAFNYHGSPFTTLGVNANGYMQFGGVAPGSYYNGTSMPNLANAVHPFSEDLYGTSGTCEIQYATTGSVGNRIFTIQWKDWGFYSGGGNEFNFQMKLYEISGVIQFVYQPLTPATSQTPQVGLTGNTVSDFNSRTNTSSWSSTTASAVNTAQMVWSPSVAPVSGLTYTFTPPPSSNLTYSWSPSTGLSSTSVSNPKAKPAGSTTYTVTVLETGTGCTSTQSITLTTVPQPTPRVTPGNDTIVCSSSLGYYVHVKDIGTYSAGYPVGTQFEWINYTPPTVGLDSIFVNISDNYACIVYLPGNLGGCSGYSDTVFVDFGTAQSPLPFMQQDSVKCFGGSNGAAIAELVSGFVPSVNYKWYNSANVLLRNVTTNVSSDTLKNVPIGWYYLHVFNGIGSPQITCIAIDSVEVFQLNPIGLTGVVTNAACYNTNTGGIVVNPVNGTAPYTYLWNNGSTNKNRVNLGKGTYYVTITDKYGCTATASYTVAQPNKLLVNLAQVNVRCGASNTGSVTANPIGGTPPFTYLWNNGQITSSIVNLTVGTYTVIVTDSKGCTNSNSTTVTQNAPLVVIVTPSPSGTSATASVSGGVGPFTYYWNSVPPQTTSTATGLTPCHTYKVKITDAKNCTKLVTFNTPCPKEIPALVSIEPAVRVYPNPTSGLLTIDAYNFNSPTLSVRLFDGLGKLVFDKQMVLESNSTTVDLSNLPKGIYMMNVMSGDKFKTVKVILQ